MSPGETLRVVIVDDDEHFRVLVAIQLEQFGISVDACDPATADPVTFVAEHRPDAVLLDWRLPGEPGPQLCRRLRGSEHGRNVAIIFLTGFTDMRDQTTARHAGADAFCAKGIVSPDALAAKIRRLVGERAHTT